jgi:hypothetical protein
MQTLLTLGMHTWALFLPVSSRAGQFGSPQWTFRSSDVFVLRMGCPPAASAKSRHAIREVFPGCALTARVTSSLVLQHHSACP